MWPFKKKQEVSSDLARLSREQYIELIQQLQHDNSVLQKMMPHGIDFSALWEEPGGGGLNLASIASFVAGGASGILLIMKIFGH